MLQRFADIFKSFRSLPAWVQIWMVLWLMPVNFASLYFLGEPLGIWIAVLAIGGMLPNGPIMYFERGVSKLMSLPHLIPWTAIIVIVIAFTPDGSPTYVTYLYVLAVTNAFSLLFDYPDAIKWMKGERDIAQ